jgi:hypothetical protein
VEEVGRDAVAVVRQLDPDDVPFDRGRDGEVAVVLGHRVTGVRHKVHEDLRELARYADHARDAGCIPTLDHDVGVPEDVLAEHERLLDHVLDHDLRCDPRRRSGVVDEIAREAEDAVGGLADAAEALEIGAVTPLALALLPQIVAVSDDRRERVVELVHDTCRELPERRELLALDHLGLQGA